MRFFSIFFFLLLTQSVFCQEIEWLSGRSHEFGYIAQGAAVQTTFRFKNLSSDSILVDLVRTTCGCTSPVWSTSFIGPGEIGSVQLAYDALKMGSFTKKARVFFLNHRRGTRLTISGEVE